MTKHSVSVVIRDAARPGIVLLVQRPADDDDLPDAWGLPAASLLQGETPEAAALRAGREKLGIELGEVRPLRSGETARAGYTLRMTLFEATILAGSPAVDMGAEGVTQYAAWRWGRADDLRPAAARGSLCCRLFLEESASGG